jgi:hypothetical protein
MCATDGAGYRRHLFGFSTASWGCRCGPTRHTSFRNATVWLLIGGSLTIGVFASISARIFARNPLRFAREPSNRVATKTAVLQWTTCFASFRPALGGLGRPEKARVFLVALGGIVGSNSVLEALRA